MQIDYIQGKKGEVARKEVTSQHEKHEPKR